MALVAAFNGDVSDTASVSSYGSGVDTSSEAGDAVHRRFSPNGGLKRRRTLTFSSDPRPMSPSYSVDGASVVSASSDLHSLRKDAMSAFADADCESVGEGGGVGAAVGEANLTPEERAARRRDARRIRNRRSAAVSRKRKREHAKKLEQQVTALNEANALLLAKLVQVQAERNWYQARADAPDNKDGAGTPIPAGGATHPLNAAPTAVSAGVAAVAIFQAALKQQAQMVRQQERARQTAQIALTEASLAEAAAKATATLVASHSEADKASAAAVAAALSPVLPTGFKEFPAHGATAPMPTSVSSGSSTVLTRRSVVATVPPALSTPPCASSFGSTDVEMSCSETQASTYSREPTVFALLIATLAQLPGMACLLGTPTHPSGWSRAEDLVASARLVARGLQTAAPCRTVRKQLACGASVRARLRRTLTTC